MPYNIKKHFLKSCWHEDGEPEPVIPDGIRQIGQNAFSRHPTLRQLVIPDGVTAIERAAFAECPALTSVRLPDTLQFIAANAFVDCPALTEVILPDNLLPISWRTFRGTPWLDALLEQKPYVMLGDLLFCASEREPHVTVPAGVRRIGREAFSGPGPHKVLRSVTLPEGLEIIGADAFRASICLESVRLPETLREIGSGAFEGCLHLEEIILPEGLKKIGGAAFMHARLRHIRIPKRVSYIGRAAFSECYPESLHWVGRADARGIRLKSSYGERQEALDAALKMAETGEVSGFDWVLYEGSRGTVGTAFLLGMLRETGNPAAEKMLRENCLPILRDAIWFGYTDIVEQFVTAGELITADAIDRLLEQAIEQKRHEIFVMLLHYKHERLGFPEDGGGFSL